MSRKGSASLLLMSAVLLMAMAFWCGRASQPAHAQQTAPAIQIDASSISASYANFSRVTGSPEELILDFGLNENPVGIPKDPIRVEHRIVMNYFTAKRLTVAMQLSIERHEQIFGTIETDVEKRMVPRR
jgi:hypothetical protein